MGEEIDKDVAAPASEPDGSAEPAQGWRGEDSAGADDGDTVRVRVLRLVPQLPPDAGIDSDLVDTVRVRVLRPGTQPAVPAEVAAPHGLHPVPLGVDPYSTDTASVGPEKARRTLDDMRKLSDEIKRARQYLKA